jgi:4-amino-4-deoxy-L-arabinose transferase-like glycosyltransferase
LYSFSRNERWALAGIVVVLIPALLVNLGIVPLYVEEPRRATVALEMLLRGNWLVPTINGEFYYLKPPLFNWILAGIYKLTGMQSEFITRIPTVISLLLFGLVIFWSGKRYVTSTFGALSAMLFFTAAGNLFFNSLLAEIDIFYSLVTYSSLVCLFHFHQERKYFLLFFSVYALGAIGILTKGFPSLVFTGLSLLVFFLVRKDFKRLFAWQHFAGIFLFMLVTVGYFFLYNQHGDVVKYLLNLSVESGKRLSTDTFWDIAGHILVYPLDTLMNLLPASMLIIFTFRKTFFKDIRANTFMRFVLLMLIVHFPIYWLPPGGRQRYIIMLYPFIIQIFTYFFLLYINEENGISRIFTKFVTVSTAAGMIVSLIPLFIDDMSFTSGLWIICISAFVILLALFIFQLRRPQFSILSLLSLLLVLRLLFGLVVLPARAVQGNAPINKQAASDISRIAGKSGACILAPTYLPMQTTYYYEKERNEILPVCAQVERGRYYIVEKILLDEYSIYNEFSRFNINPLKPLTDRLSNIDNSSQSRSDFTTILEFKLQKRNYLVIRPE